MRERLGRHFVQRRRIDIREGDWHDENVFPEHQTADAPFDLTGRHPAFQDEVLDYCLAVTEGAGADERRRRLAFWGTLALMRCVGSSPAAAASALRNRLARQTGLAVADEADVTDDAAAVFDEDDGAHRR